MTMVYYGLSLNVGNIGGNIYLNNLLSTVAELLGYLVALAGLDRLGRKGMHCSSMILGGLACLASIFPVMFAGPGHCEWLSHTAVKGLNPSMPQHVTFPGRKMHGRTCKLYFPVL